MTLNWFFEHLKDDNLCLLYNGNFTDDITDKIIELNEYNSENKEEPTKIRKRVSYLMAECFQNVIRHNEKDNKKRTLTKEPDFFMARNISNKYYITSGNLINNKNIDALKSQLDHINTLDQDELKVLFKKVMTEGEISSKGGAGLGLIDMARKSGQKLGYQFSTYDNNQSIFYNQIIMESEPDSETKISDNFNIQYAIDFHSKMINEDILMLQKGDYSRESILPVLKIIENNIIHEYQDSNLLKEVYHVLVELLQNISRYGYGKNNLKEGIFSLFKKGDHYGISTGNFIENSKIKKLEGILIHINSLNKDELKDLYLHQLKYGDETQGGGAGIGLIDIARLLTEDIKFNFTKKNEQISFFTLSVII